MNRKDFLSRVGLLGLTSVMPLQRSRAEAKAGLRAALLGGAGCVLIPSETRGPFPLDLSSDASKFRRAINESKTGVPLNLELTIVNVNDDCAPMSNVRVDVWHCDKDGVYSGFNQAGADTTGQTFCRGIQLSDANGKVSFTTIYPGWYPGRTTHIHFELYLNSVLSAVSQLCFPEERNKQVYATTEYTRGQNTSVSSNTADNVFSDGVDLQLAGVTENTATGGYDASLTVGVAGGTTGVYALEPETGGQFKLLPNHPNPFSSQTSIPFELRSAAHVLVELYDVQGRKVMELANATLEAGEHTVVLDLQSTSVKLSDAVYIYQLTTTNAQGRFAQCKAMTLQ